jgi:hypothetical protein
MIQRTLVVGSETGGGCNTVLGERGGDCGHAVEVSRYTPTNDEAWVSSVTDTDTIVRVVEEHGEEIHARFGVVRLGVFLVRVYGAKPEATVTSMCSSSSRSRPSASTWS